MEIELYQIDAFANERFAGNPAAVCLLPEWIEDDLMQAIAAENNLSETAYVVRSGEGYDIRWFTPTREVDLCGHATLASAYVVFEKMGHRDSSIRFQSKSGPLVVKRQDAWLEMDFPAQAPRPCAVHENIRNAFNLEPVACLEQADFIVVLESEEQVASADPDLSALSQLPLRGVALTAPSSRFDFVTRFFAPKFGIDEDPVTGSAFTQLIPYWSESLGKHQLWAKQISKRGGVVRCGLYGDRVTIAGKTAPYLSGRIVV